MKSIFLWLSLSLLSYQASAQPFADKEFYLVDSIVLDSLLSNDRVLLDSILTAYHSYETDTSRIKALSNLIATLGSPDLKPSYNQVYRNTLEAAEDQLSEKERAFYWATYWSNVAEHYYRTQDVKNSIVNYQKAADILTETDNETLRSEILGNIAFLLSEQSDYPKAFAAYDEAIASLKLAGNQENLALTYINMGHLYFEVSETETAIDLFTKGIAEAKAPGNSTYTAYGYRSLGHFLVEEERYHEADSILRLALKEQQNEINDYGLLSINALLTTSNIGIDNYDDAEKFGQAALDFALKLNSKNTEALMLAQLAQLAYLKEDFSKAEKLAKEGLLLATELQSVNNRRHCAKVLSDVYEQRKDWKNAFEMEQLYATLKDSTIAEDNKATAIREGAKYQYQKQKELDDLATTQKLELAAAETKRQQQLSIAAAIIALLVLLAAAFIYSRLRIINRQKKELDAAYAQLEESKKNELAYSNLKALQSQMNPHFIFNALNSVQDLVMLKDIRNSNRYLGKFSDLIRKILLSSKEQFIPLDEELEMLQLYLDLEQLRFGEEFHQEITCSISDTEQQQIQLPAMFIQPYVENAIKHGLFHKEGDKRLCVAFTKEQGFLRCEVEDNGVGQVRAAELKVKNLHLHTGFSTEAINERIRLLNETLEHKIELEVIDLTDTQGNASGTRIVLRFPVN